MPIRVSNSVEKNVVNVPKNLVVLTATTAKDVLPNATSIIGELAGRYVQNVGANDCYYVFGSDCSPVNFNGILAANTGNADVNGFKSGQQLDASNCGQRLSMYSVGGTTISITLLARNDNAGGSGGIL